MNLQGRVGGGSVEGRWRVGGGSVEVGGCTFSCFFAFFMIFTNFA